MGVYVYKIKGKSRTALNPVTGEQIKITNAEYHSRYWEDLWSNKNVWNTREMKRHDTIMLRMEKEGKLGDFVSFGDPVPWNETYTMGLRPELGERDLPRCIYNRKGHFTWYDTPDYNNEGSVAVCKKVGKTYLMFPKYFRLNERLMKVVDIHSESSVEAVYYNKPKKRFYDITEDSHIITASGGDWVTEVLTWMPLVGQQQVIYLHKLMKQQMKYSNTKLISTMKDDWTYKHEALSLKFASPEHIQLRKTKSGIYMMFSPITGVHSIVGNMDRVQAHWEGFMKNQCKY